MKRTHYRNIVIDNVSIDKLHIFLDDNGEIIVLPNLWLLHLAIKQEAYSWRTTGSFRTSRFLISRPQEIKKTFKAWPISNNTVDNYVGHVYKLLKYINSEEHLCVHRTENLTSRFLNYYLNEILPKQLKSSESLKAHQAGITAYCNFLCALGIWNEDDSRPTTIYRKTRQYMAEHDNRAKKINYITKAERNDLLRLCTNKRDKLILRMGYEVGLRAEENVGLELHSKGAHRGLISLFDELEKKPEKYEFEYEIRGKFTKGGRSGYVYFDRELLIALKNYYQTEREQILSNTTRQCETLFVRNDPRGKGLTICARHASTVFSETKKMLPNINKALSYHDLRHTFATELYHEELKTPNGQENRSESAALEVVRIRLRHAEGSRTTTRYIRLYQQMKMLEDMV